MRVEHTRTSSLCETDPILHAPVGKPQALFQNVSGADFGDRARATSNSGDNVIEIHSRVLPPHFEHMRHATTCPGLLQHIRESLTDRRDPGMSTADIDSLPRLDRRKHGQRPASNNFRMTNPAQWHDLPIVKRLQDFFAVVADHGLLE